ncbi:MAG: sigma-54 dependent transcriptional regulator [Candidatus Methylacidiphilales bacterium]|nr:sigma-54 dependent transcriptional regulator [Candidatus Methylacidiphilales bacterium]
MKLERILVLDDEDAVRAVMTDLLRELGYTPLAVATLQQARSLLKQDNYDLILSDVRLSDGNGLDFLQEAKQIQPQTRLVVMTGYGSLDSAVEAIRLGVFDYLLKPINLSRLKVTLERLEEIGQLQSENTYLRREVRESSLEGIEWGRSPAMGRVRELIEKLGTTDATVMIQGESGTGKEVVARELHARSNRATRPFIRVNCAAIPATLLESEFFGHEKGAFTGAVQRREGRFEVADGGTLLLDEISEIPSDLQVKLLRVLQEREFERVGGNKTIPVDVRVLATTNRNLKEEVRAGRFREDLYYRLNVVPIDLPPLRERGNDILHLAEHFLRSFSRKHGKAVRSFDAAVKSRLLAYSWPGNVRELQNAVERAVILAEAGTGLTVDDFAFPHHEPSEGGPSFLGKTIDELEYEAIREGLKAQRGNRTRTAESLGISLRTLRNKLARYRREARVIEESRDPSLD